MSDSCEDDLPVVTATWLKERLEADDTGVVVLNVTHISDEQPFEQKRIPGSVWFNIMHEVPREDLFPYNLPDPDSFQQYVRSLGINSNAHIVVYSSEEKRGYYDAGRVWWMFKLHGHERVSVLDGGIGIWQRLGFPVETETPEPTEGDFTVMYNSKYLMRYEDMVENLHNKDLQVCDTRGKADYKGDKHKARTGHYPGAASLPFGTALLSEDQNSLNSIERLKKAFTDAGVELGRPVVGMCWGGMGSCTLVLAAALCGAHNVALYLGSFTEWGTRAGVNQIQQG